METSTEARWYIVHTYSGYENKVKTNLEKIIENRGISHLITDVRIPTEIVVDESGKEKENKLFPSYVFVRMIMSDETWHVVRNITGATGFVGPGSRPVPLTDKEVDDLGISVRAAAPAFSAGDSVKIKSGPMAGFVGKVESISPDGKKVTVLASVFGRETPVELDTASIELED
ncbi:MAG: transcription termination/antitermination factor NusG [Ruminococcus sp.]|nr:transcription termination/antitermination factor NusG [Candidatus Apopatosoma intestinale]